jgi:proteasome accessory factor C
LIEEYPMSEKFIEKQEDKYILTTEVGNYLGVGRFILGLPGEIEVLYPQSLKDYLNEKTINKTY